MMVSLSRKGDSCTVKWRYGNTRLELSMLGDGDKRSHRIYDKPLPSLASLDLICAYADALKSCAAIIEIWQAHGIMPNDDDFREGYE